MGKLVCTDDGDYSTGITYGARNPSGRDMAVYGARNPSCRVNGVKKGGFTPEVCVIDCLCAGVTVREKNARKRTGRHHVRC